jgi:hypothetical protein
VITKSTIAGILIPALAFAMTTPAVAGSPGMGGEVYGATVEKGETEVEARYGRLTGGANPGEDVLKLEAAYGVSDRLRIGVVGEFGKEPGDSRKLNAASIEAIYALGKAGGIDFAAYGEYEFAFDGPDEIEAKLLMQHRSGPWDMRLNLIASKEMVAGASVELGYAASADMAVAKPLRLGVSAFGNLGTFSQFGPSAEHYAGPIAKIRLTTSDPDGDGDDHGGLGLTAGYLFALGATRDQADGQLHLKLEMEF